MASIRSKIVFHILNYDNSILNDREIRPIVNECMDYIKDYFLNNIITMDYWFPYNDRESKVSIKLYKLSEDDPYLSYDIDKYLIDETRFREQACSLISSITTMKFNDMFADKIKEEMVNDCNEEKKMKLKLIYKEKLWNIYFRVSILW